MREGYISIFIDGMGHSAHRLAHLYMTGEWPIDVIDHINRVTGDNRWENLRSATRSQNLGNRRLNVNSRGGLKGVTPLGSGRNAKWYQSRIQVGGKRIRIGIFTTPEEAHAAYVDAAKKYFGEFARFS